MYPSPAQVLRTFGFNLLYWIFLLTLVLATRFYRIGEITDFAPDFEVPLGRLFLNGFIFGSAVAFFYTIMEFRLMKRGVYEFSLARIMINRTLIQVFITFMILLGLTYLNYKFDVKHNIERPGTESFHDYMSSATAFFLLFWAFIGNIVLSIFRVLQMKIGKESFYDLLLGKFKPAREEDRAFLFIDLRSSTTIAEQLGHFDYSYFIQDCFRDLNKALVKTNAEIYQYVGDEAILTWRRDEAFVDNNCLKAFFEFEKALLENKNYYQNRYGTVPVFKAGLNVGKVMTAEVGVIKRDIAYHSDVLNTAARVQGLCNEKGARLLVTKSVLDQLEQKNGFEFLEVGSVLLKGKNVEVEVYAVEE